MGIQRIVSTSITCDECGKEIVGWRSSDGGVSKEWAKYHARKKGATVGTEYVTCKECRIKKKQKKCKLIKRIGYPGQDKYGRCLGFGCMDECIKCIAYRGFYYDK